MKSRWYLLAAGLAFWATAMAQTPAAPVSPAERPDYDRMIDAIFAKWDKADTPGAGVAVIQNGKVVFEKGYGIANLEYEVPIRPQTVFHVASVSKQFTAMAVVLLEADGKLTLEDDIHRYLPELPDYGHAISVRNLLQHTSGIRDQWQTLALSGWTLEDVITQDQILRLLFRQKELNFPPGTQMLYSNGGYTLLAEIVTRVSGRPFPKFCAERIFEPLGMTRTHFHQDLTQVVPQRAYSYRRQNGDYVASPLNYANVGATSLFTTAGDLVKWLDNFREPKVGGAAAIARLQERAVLSSGKQLDYALGIGVGSYRGARLLSHDGADAGYRSSVFWFPDQNLGIAVLSNLGNFAPGNEAKKVGAVFLGDALEAETPPEAVARTFITVEAADLEAYVGIYPLPQISQTLHVVIDKGKLWFAGPVSPPIELRPTGKGRFFTSQIAADSEFTALADGGMKITVTQPGAVNEGIRSGVTPIFEKAWAHYEGAYWNEELEAQYRFVLKNETLVGMHVRHGEIALTPLMKDEFSSDRWFMRNVKFVRDDANEITAVLLGGGRVREVRFVRKPPPAEKPLISSPKDRVTGSH